MVYDETVTRIAKLEKFPGKNWGITFNTDAELQERVRTMFGTLQFRDKLPLIKAAHPFWQCGSVIVGETFIEFWSNEDVFMLALPEIEKFLGITIEM